MKKEHYSLLIIITLLFIVFAALLLTIRHHSDFQYIFNNAAISTNPVDITVDGKININTATSKELEMLPGIGNKISQRIIEYRAKNGPFNDIADLKKIKGIGTELFNKISDYITVGN